MFLTKIRYGFVRLFEDLSNKEDYWHARLMARTEFPYKELYYLNFTPKSNYPFKKNNSIPIVEMNGEEMEFSITIFNYGLGLIDELHSNPNNIFHIKNILEWIFFNQGDDGGWHNDYSISYLSVKPGWSSAMGQGLAISFIYRCYLLNLISKDIASEKIEIAKNHMLSDELSNETVYGIILQEFGGASENVLNGYIFAIYGLYDYALFTGKFDYFDYHISVLKSIIVKYNFVFNWSYYTTTKTIASLFYHQLHIDMMYSLHHITKDLFFLKKARFWEKSLRFGYLFIFIKAIQKVLNMSSLNTINRQ
ncbi:MAG: hypothetical protein JZU53_12210 [Paludibacter sp.]|nr:hypothetical protein [Paludibacter sp.]